VHITEWTSKIIEFQPQTAIKADYLEFFCKEFLPSVRIKGCGFGRVDFAVAPVLQQIHSSNPDVLMFGSDLPSTRAPRGFEASAITLLADALGEAGAHKALWPNARSFYGL